MCCADAHSSYRGYRARHSSVSGLQQSSSKYHEKRDSSPRRNSPSPSQDQTQPAQTRRTLPRPLPFPFSPFSFLFWLKTRDEENQVSPNGRQKNGTTPPPPKEKRRRKKKETTFRHITPNLILHTLNLAETNKHPPPLFLPPRSARGEVVSCQTYLPAHVPPLAYLGTLSIPPFPL